MAPNKSDRKVYEGEVLGSAKRTISAVDGFAALSQLVTVVQECIEIHAVEQTKRARLHTYATAEIQRIKSAESIVKGYFEQSFAERRATFDALFVRLNQALEQENSQVISEVLRGIVDIAKTSPLADLGDLAQIRAALDDPDQVWDL
ncbi:hypothetical protein [Rhodococcus phenolicus]|uniref:hypothetical protein n=1 Tax=Rhodococcus phenolicus TaxID=263849 RepID=UPI0008304B9E|nr:hypothetical protein [Rhodococcus phenolicus]